MTAATAADLARVAEYKARAAALDNAYHIQNALEHEWAAEGAGDLKAAREALAALNAVFPLYQTQQS